MNNFYIITNEQKDKDLRITNKIHNYIIQNGRNCILSVRDSEGHILRDTVPKGIECAVVLGGDGTMIRAARELAGLEIPLLGINLGTLGYLTEAEAADYRPALDRVFEQKSNIENRMMLRGTINGELHNTALNDIVIAREGNFRIVGFDIFVNGIHLNKYLADGMIISTPTGSTGYNMSAGGPIVEPTASLIVLTPICCHALNNSSIVLSGEDIIEVEISADRYGGREQVAIAFDGADKISLVTGDRITIRRSGKVTKLVKLTEESFMKTMSKKMKGN